VVVVTHGGAIVATLKDLDTMGWISHRCIEDGDQKRKKMLYVVTLRINVMLIHLCILFCL
jgi:hypothetical protein